MKDKTLIVPVKACQAMLSIPSMITLDGKQYTVTSRSRYLDQNQNLMMRYNLRLHKG